jgi:hypothetical protein
MNKSICTTIRLQLDEMMLGEDCAHDVSQHLSECGECHDFHQKQTRLRQIVGSLGTVNAPPDFDFRLRSRLANENTNSSFHLSHSIWSLGQRSVAVATALVLVVGAVVLFRQWSNRNDQTRNIAEKNGPQKENSVPSVAPPVVEQNPIVKDARQIVSSGTDKGGDKVVRRPQSNGSRINRPLVTEDLASQRAPVFRGTSDVFPVDAGQQSLKVSLFDGRGNPKTISLPTVTFGSQRVVPTATAYAPKGVW